MKVHRSVPENQKDALDVLALIGTDEDKHLAVVPGSFAGRDGFFLVAHMVNPDSPDRVVIAPLAFLVTPEHADVITLDLPGAVRENAAPSAPSGPQEGEAIKVLRDALPVLPGVLGERAARVLRGAMPAAPAAERVGVYL